MSAAIRSLDDLDADLVPMEPEAPELAPALEDAPLSMRLEDLDPTIDVDAEMRQRLIADESLDSDAFNQARLEGPPGVNPIAVADRPELYAKPPLVEAEQVLRDRPRMRDAVMKDRDISRGVAVTRWPNWARAWDSIASHVPEIAGASKDQVEITTRQYRRGYNGTAEMLGALYGEPIDRDRRRSMDEDTAEMAELQKSIEGLPRALQWIPGGIGQAPNMATGMGARAVGLGLGAAPAAIPVVGPGIAAVTIPALGTGLPVAWTGMIEGGNWYADYMAANPDEDRKTAAVGGLLIGLVNGSLELLPIDVGLGTLTGNAKREMVKLMADREFRDVLAFAGKRWALGVGAEGITEALQQIGPTLGNNVQRYADGEITAGELIKTIASEALEAGIVGAEYSILPGGANVAIASAGAQAQVERAKGVRDRFSKIAETSVENAEIIQSAPDKYQKLIDEAAQDGSGIDSVYVPADALEAAYADAAPAWQNLNQKIDGLPERLAEARATNGKVRFSIGEFSTWVAGAEQFDKLGDHLSFRETQPSLEEARKFGSPEVMQSVVDAMNAFRSSSEVDPVAVRENEAAFAKNMEAIFAEKLPAVGLRVRQKAAQIFARSISRISEMSGQDPLEYMASVLDRVELEQRPELDSPTEVERANAFGTDRFRAGVDLAYLTGKVGEVAAIGPESGTVEAGGISRLTSTTPGPLPEAVSSRYVQTDDQGNIVAALQVTSLDGKQAQIANVFVAPEARRQGIATALLGRARQDFERVDHSDDLSDDGEAFAASDTYKQTVEKIQIARNDWTENSDGQGHLDGLTETQQGKLRAARTAVEAAIEAGLERARARGESAAGAQAGGVEAFQAGRAGQTRGQLVVDRAFKRFLVQISEGRVDDSTLVHELAHLTLELVLDMAEQDGAADDIRDYAGQALKFLGVENRGQIQAKHHERWAESWELYLREGKAPSADLAGAFAFFRSRLLKIYESLRGRLMEADHDLTFVPLFDRLLATEDEIRSAKGRTDLMTAFADRAAVAGLEDAERDEVVALLREAQGEERKKLERIIAREQARVLKEQRGELREKIAEEVYARPEQRLRHWLVKGVLPDGEHLPNLSTGKLSRADVEAIGGDASKLPRGTWTREGGWDPGSVAAAFGYSSPEEMLDALERSERPQDIISRRVQEEAERLGLVATADELEAMAAESLAGPQRDRLYELERRIAARLRRADTATRTAEERAIAGRAAPAAGEARARVTAAQAALDEAVARQADQAEIDLLQVELKRAQDAVEVARVARQDQGEAAAWTNAVLGKIPAKERTALYRAAAQRIVDGVQVKDLKRELRSWVHRRAKAAQAKVSAQIKRDWVAFDAAIEAEQISNALVEIGSAQVMEAKKQRRALSDLKKTGSRTRARLAKYAWEVDSAGNRTNLLDLIDEMLAQVSFGEVSNRRLAYAVDIERFAQTLAAERGIDLPLPSWVLDLKEAPSYKTMTTAELGELYRTVKALEKHGLQLAREAEGALAADEKDLLDEGRAALDERMPSIAAIRANFEKVEGDQRKSKASRFVASMMSLPTIATYLDNMHPEGFFTRTFIHPMREAAQVETRLKKSTAQMVNAAWDRYSPLEKRQFYTHRIRIDSIGQSLTKNAILAIAAQQGNEHNRAALRDGKPYGFTDEQLREILSHVTDKDAEFLIAVAEAIDSLWPEASAAQKRMNGEIAPKVTGEPWQLPSGKWMPGFYFPLRWNTELHDRAQQYEDREKGLDAFSFHSGAVMTKPGAMNARKKTSGGMTVSSDFMGTVTGHLDDMTKAIAWQETLVKLDRLAKKLAPELKRVAGSELYRQFRETFIRVAQSERGVRNVGWLNNAAGHARGGLSLIAMGWRLTSAAIQVTGFLPAIHLVGAANVAAGYTKLYHNPLGASSAIAALRAEIPALVDRAEKFDRDAQQSMLRLNPVDVKHPVKSLKPIRSIASHYGFYLLGMIDTFTASAVAAAAMRQALNGEVVGIKAGDRVAAARYADGIVRSTQGSGETMDLPAIMDGDNLQKMMTTMMTYTNAQLQQAVLAGALTYEQRREAKDAKKRGVPVVPHNRPKFLAFMAFTYLVAPVLEETIRAMIKSASGDPPEEDEWLASLMLKIGFGPVGGVPIARDMYSYASGYGAGETPFATTFDIYGKTLETSYEMFTDDFDGEKMLRAWAAFGTYTTGAPTKAMVDAAEVVMQEPIGRERR